MDRNVNPYKLTMIFGVALRKESVDRNISLTGLIRIDTRVALRKESVDRMPKTVTPIVSLSARRAWIETPGALRTTENQDASLSARRAWIETYRRSP